MFAAAPCWLFLFVRNASAAGSDADDADVFHAQNDLVAPSQLRINRAVRRETERSRGETMAR